MITSLWCVRHAPVFADGICYGQHDVPTRIDAEEAATIALASLGDARLDAVYGSPWARSHDVARAIARRRGLPFIVDARVAELSMGEWEGRAFAEIEKTDADRFARWMEHWRTESPPGGETLDAFRARVDSFLDEACRMHETTRLVVTHAGVIRAVRARVAGIGYDVALAAKVEHLAAERFEVGRAEITDR